MFWSVIGIILVLWFLGVIGNIGGQFIHLLLIVAGALLIFNLIRNRRPAF
ncbi:MAG: lmo0937 family membrane protein [Acidobacteriota bacterium]